MGANCSPLIADLFLFCYEGVFRMSHFVILRLMSLKPLTQRLDIWTTVLILKEWLVEFILPHCSLIELTLLIPRPRF